MKARRLRIGWRPLKTSERAYAEPERMVAGGRPVEVVRNDPAHWLT
jgi:hypothetical protein